MKIILLLSIILLNLDAWGLCNTPITRRNVNTGEINYSAVINSDFNNLYTKANSLSGDCFIENSIPASALADGSIVNDDFANGTILAAKFAPGVFPSYQRLLRVRAYVNNATWVRSNDVKAIFVQMVGGGGASYDSPATATNSTASKFGLHCTANGGEKTNTTTPGMGGTATDGDINLSGGDGYRTTSKSGCTSLCIPECSPATCYYNGAGGQSILSPNGNGGSSGIAAAGGGAGGYCAKLIPKESLNSSETISVGGAGSVSGTAVMTEALQLPFKGIVIIYEFGE